MKNLKLFLFAFIAVSATIISMSSCSKNETEIGFDQTLLYGKWQENTLFEVYKADGTGYTWDINDDVTEQEAQPFTWTLEENVLTHIHIMEMGSDIPKRYTVTNLTATTLTYEDDLGKKHTFSKVQ